MPLFDLSKVLVASRTAMCLAFLTASIAAASGVANDNGRTKSDRDRGDSGTSVTTSHRHTPLVEAVSRIRPSVVNIRGKKTIRRSNIAGTDAQLTKQVNGMGTGVFLDPRGYILTNHHVVENVSRIEVTLFDGTTTTGQLIAIDNRSDLALLKINVTEPMPVVPIGTSTDLMLAESVAAVGNAFGYEHTVTRGIISEIGRTVQVSNDQIYYNLIQTDAAINPGNSGGPLLNMDGEMIGINVAVRVGAQGIAFAIPVNDAIDIAADLMEEVTSSRVHPGFTTRTIYENHYPKLVVETVDPESSAEQAGLKPGDRIVSINSSPCYRRVDLHRHLFDRVQSDTLRLELDRMSTPVQIALSGASGAGGADFAWNKLGLKLRQVERKDYRELQSEYRFGLQVDAVRRNSPAFKQGLKTGDIIVVMDNWQTESIENLKFVLDQANVTQGKSFEFYIFRGKEPLKGQIRVARISETLHDRSNKR